MTPHDVSRRAVLAALAATAVPVSAASPPLSLGQLAAQKGILFGTAVGGGRRGTLTGMLADRRMMALVDRECAVVVPENEMKQYVVAAHADTLDFVPGDALADWATRHGKKLRGHTLLWNRAEYIPRWLSERYADAPAAALATWLTGYVGATAAHFGARIHSWDVVNETVDPATGALRDTMFNRKLGFDALRLAFTAARERAPHAQRVYNDYMSWDAGSAKHRAGVLKLLERFRAEAVPVDALGIQSHIGAEGDMTTTSGREREWRGFVDAVVAMGYRLLITEFDVSDQSAGGTVSTRDAPVAAVGKAYLDMMLSYRQLDHLLCWGLVDRYSWLQNFSPRRISNRFVRCPTTPVTAPSRFAPLSRKH